MTINTMLLNKQIEIFVKDFFVDKLLVSKVGQDEDFYIELNEYLNTKLTDLKKYSGLDFSVKDYQKSLIALCLKMGVLDEIAPDDQQKATEALLDILNDQYKVSDDIIDRLSYHIRQAFKNGLDINKLYAPAYFDKELKNDSDLHANVNKYMQIIQGCDLKESIGVINTFIETSKWSKERVDEILKKSNVNMESDNPTPADIRRKQQRESKNFLRYIAREINKTSLSDNPFSLENDKLNFNRRTGSEFDHFMYSPETKTFSICLATKSKSTKIEKNNIFSQPISLLYICNSLMSHVDTGQAQSPINEKEPNLVPIFRKALSEEYNFRTESLKGNYVPSDDDLTAKNIKAFNKRPNLILKNLIAQGELPVSIIKKFQNVGQMSMIESYSKDDEELYNLLKDNLCSFRLDEKAVEKLFSVLTDSKDFKTEIYFFGEVSSKRNKQFDYSSRFSDEEVRAGANILAYAGKAMDGFDGIEITPTAAITFLEKLKFRFNTSTNQKQNCIDLIKLNDNLRDIGGVIINNFMQNENLPQVLKMYRGDNGATRGMESMEVLHNISLFEKNIIGQIIERIEEGGMTPQAAYVDTFSGFNTSPRMSLEMFVDNLEKKLELINDEIISGNLDKLSILKHTIENHKLVDQSLKNIETVIKSLKASNIDNSIIKTTVSEMLKNSRITEDKMDFYIDSFFKEEPKVKIKNSY